MQHGMNNAIDLLRIERELLDRELKHHHLISENRLRHPHPSLMARLAAHVRFQSTPKRAISLEHGI